MSQNQIPTCIVHIGLDGNTDFAVCGDARLLTIDERAPHDRVYEVSRRISQDQLAALIGDSPVGNAKEISERHAALLARVPASLTGKPHLSIVTGEQVD